MNMFEDLPGQLLRAVAADPVKRWVRTDIKTGERTEVDRRTLVQVLSVAYRVPPQDVWDTVTKVEGGMAGDLMTLAAVYTYTGDKL